MEQRRPRRLPEIIYIRRRVAAAALVIVLVLIAVIVMVLFGHRSGNSPDTTATTTSPASSGVTSATTSMSGTTTATTAAEAATGSATTTEKPNPLTTVEPTTTIVKEPQVKTTCALEDLVVTATSDKAVYAPGELPKFYLTVTNPTQADCVINLSKDALRFEVYNLTTNLKVWSDIDCNPSEGVGTQTFPAGKKRHYEAIWSRKGSAANMCDDRQPVPAGGYYLHTLIGDNHSDAHTFNLN